MKFIIFDYTIAFDREKEILSDLVRFYFFHVLNKNHF